MKRERTDSESETACSLGNAEEDLPAAKRVKEEEAEHQRRMRHGWNTDEVVNSMEDG